MRCTGCWWWWWWWWWWGGCLNFMNQKESFNMDRKTNNKKTNTKHQRWLYSNNDCIPFLINSIGDQLNNAEVLMVVVVKEKDSKGLGSDEQWDLCQQSEQRHSSTNCASRWSPGVSHILSFLLLGPLLSMFMICLFRLNCGTHTHRSVFSAHTPP